MSFIQKLECIYLECSASNINHIKTSILDAIIVTIYQNVNFCLPTKNSKLNDNTIQLNHQLVVKIQGVGKKELPQKMAYLVCNDYK